MNMYVPSVALPRGFFLSSVSWGFHALLLLTFFRVEAQVPRGATLTLNSMATAEWTLPATIEMVVTGLGNKTFTGSNNKLETGSPLFSVEPQKEGATFYRCDSVLGFPSPTIASRPFPNRSGGSSFIALKTEPNGYRKYWINATIGAFRIVAGTGTTFNWEYQVRYFSGDTNRNLPESMTVGVVPNSGFHSGSPLTSFSVDIKTDEMRIMSLRSPYGGEPYFLKDVDFDVEWTATVDWGTGGAPGSVRFFTSKGVREVPATGTTNRIILNMGKDFEVGSNLVAMAVAPDGTTSQPRRAEMVIMTPIPDENYVVNETTVIPGIGTKSTPEFSYSLTPTLLATLLELDVPEGKVPKSLPFFGGRSINFNFIPDLSISVSSSGLREPTLNLFSAESAFTKDLKKIGKSPGQILKYIQSNADRLDNLRTGLPQLKAWDRKLYLGVSVGGEWQYNKQSQSWVSNANYIQVAGGYSASFSRPFLLPPSPISPPMPAYLKVSGSLEASAKANWTMQPLAFDVPVSATTKLRGSAGLGVNELIASEVWVEGSFVAGIKFSELKPAPDQLKLSIALGGTAYALVFKAEKEFYRRTFDLLKDDPDEEEGAALNDLGPVLRLLDREYLSEMSRAFQPRRALQHFGAAGAHVAGRMTLESPAYPLAEPSLSGNASQLMLLWLRDNPARGPYDRTEIVWATFNGQEWSTPKPLADDGTADFKPQVVLLPDGSAVAAWENQRVVHQPNTPELTAYASQLEIAVARFEPVARQWSKPTTLRAGDFLNASPKLAVAMNGEAVVTWTGIPDNDLLGGGAEPHEIWFSRTTAGQWSTPARVAKFTESVLRSDLAFDGNRAELVVSVDGDRDFLTVGDRELYRLSLSQGGWSERVRLTEDAVPDENPKLGIDDAGEVHLYWLRTNEICAVKSFRMGERHVAWRDEYSANLGNFKLVRGAEGLAAIVWAESTATTSSDLRAVVFDPQLGEWSEPKILTNDPETESAITAAYLGNRTLSAVYTRRLVAPTAATGNAPAIGAAARTELMHLLYEPGLDLAVDPENLVMLPESPAPGSTISLWPDIVNVGDFAVSNLLVALVRNDSEIVARTNLATVLRGGERREVQLNWELPPISGPINLAVVVDPEARWNDVARANNRVPVTVVQSDLAIQSVAWTETATNTLIVSAWILNRGNYTSGIASIEIRDGSKAGPILGTQSLGSLIKGQSTNVVWNLALSDNLPPASIYVGLTGEGIDAETIRSNNEAILTLREIIPPKLSASVRPEDGALEVILDGGPHASYRVEISTDLRQWEAWTNVVSTQGTTRLIDPDYRSGKQRFYRAILDP